MGFKALLFGFQGRINRGQFWLTQLLYLVVLPLLLMVASQALGTVNSAGFDAGSKLAWGLAMVPVVLFGGPLVVVTIWASVATAIKRLHDRDKSGWWLALFYLLPSVLGNAAERLGGHMIAVSIACEFAAAVLSVWAFVELFCLRGSDGQNRFGRIPLRGKLSTQQARA